MTAWKHFYNNIKDPSWPVCDEIENFIHLPPNIQIEIVKDYLFENQMERLKKNLEHVDFNFANFLYHLDKVKSLIGSKNCLMNTQDVMFLYSILYCKRPDRILEIGRFKGWSSSIICGAIRDNNCGHLWSVDVHDIVDQRVKELCQPYTTFITADSKNLLELREVKDQKFQVIFIDGDHSYQMVYSDFQKSYQLSDSQAWLLLHDADMETTKRAISDFIEQTPGLLDCGMYGEKIQLIYKKV